MVGMVGARSGGGSSPVDKLIRAAQAYAAEPDKYLEQVGEIERRRAELRDEEARIAGLAAAQAERETQAAARDRQLREEASRQAEQAAALRGEQADLDRGRAALEQARRNHAQAAEATAIGLAAERRELDAYKTRLDDRDVAQVKRAGELEQAEADAAARQAVVAAAERRIRDFAASL